jgi:hypothetical protein
VTSLDWHRYFTPEVMDEALRERKRRPPRLSDPFARFPTRRYWLRRMNRPVSPPLEPVTAGRSGVFAAVFAARAKRLDE